MSLNVIIHSEFALGEAATLCALETREGGNRTRFGFFRGFSQFATRQSYVRYQTNASSACACRNSGLLLQRSKTPTGNLRFPPPRQQNSLVMRDLDKTWGELPHEHLLLTI